MLCIIILLAVPSLSLEQPLWTNPTMLAIENDPIHPTIDDKFIVSFDLNCLSSIGISKEIVIEQFNGLFECFNLNNAIVDSYPDITDHWIYMERTPNCHDEDEYKLNWDDYCISNVIQDQEIKLSDTSQCISKNVETALWNLNSICSSITNGIQYIKFKPGYNPNIDIVVMDTGIDASHSQFDGITIEKIYDAYPGQPMHSHGTHCSGTILGKDYGAFDATSLPTKLLDVRILDARGYGHWPSVFNGYDAIIDYLDNNPGKKVIINMSFGGGNNDRENQRLASIRSKGGISVAAAGNENQPASAVSPASSLDVITVGAVDQNNNRAWFSNYGTSVDIWAPGVGIKSAIVGGGTTVWSGTSMAAPLVVSVAANIWANNPELDFQGIKSKLLTFASFDVNDGRGNTKLPRVQASCVEYSDALTREPTAPTESPTASTQSPTPATVPPTQTPSKVPTSITNAPTKYCEANVDICGDLYQQVGGCGADIPGCGLQGCDKRYQNNYPSAAKCAEGCLLHGNCIAFTWAPIGDDTGHPSNSVCTLYDRKYSGQSWGNGNQYLCEMKGLDGDDLTFSDPFEDPFIPF